MTSVQQRLQASSKPRAGQPSAGPRPPQQPPSANAHGAVPTASPLSLFLTNLRLLDLDRRRDWPDISTRTFATGTTTAQGQKKRVQSVEWALFQLFALWDPEETANKLKPYFPPLDQVQSINLRAALLRSLENAKKNGVLGRDALLRKTMLDECKGERLEEVLAAFSAAVLRKVAVDQLQGHPALSLTLTLENKGYNDDKNELSTLILAHKHSLGKIKERRRDTTRRYRHFEGLLGVKERGLAQRKEEALRREQGGPGKTISEEARAEMARLVRTNWTGNEKWMNILVQGDATEKKDGPFGMPLDRVWRRVEQDRLGEVEAKDAGLLEQLHGRVTMHRERLDKWQRFRASMYGERPAQTASSSKTKAESQGKGMDLGLGAHEELRLCRATGTSKTPSQGLRLTSDYQEMLQGLKDELAEAGHKPSPLPFLQAKGKGKRISMGTQESISEISELSELEDDTMDRSPDEGLVHSVPAMNDEQTIRPGLSRASSSSEGLSSPSKPRRCQNFTDDDDDEAGDGEDDDTVRLDFQPKLRPDTSLSPIRRQKTPIQQAAPSLTQAAADRILESMNDASPSPKKKSRPRHTLSLADRTRLSMAPRGSSIFLEEEEGEGGSETNKPTPATTSAETTETLENDILEDLAARTRRSMAGFENARQKAQVERRRSQRKSRVPPRREGSYFPKLEEQDTLTEEMIAEEDMEAVFRSRPKIQASPLPSPTREDFGDY
ncbi:HAUS augmin-like complex subunit 6 N-terminus-domain-containing protein [Emericellopsis atlantica]|uniref:HAUS augmin-like complex subunit 6 N-terminus-domain-containing protein n=1 Tax=Emericellopsis atlantica TaxID=2614577 RepID=A0A9P7ZGA6_9HYPO|nr:HAUS augmin-like complex subunit 6 N-terminus-domain-containing protein [Emericellopsis atlantica]KAG9251603.1 HAUS augmin-like complex subunit 6 N-terminus-domain-containing protein [Emericellopsis atlantica]